jgi:hypothetical protein
MLTLILREGYLCKQAQNTGTAEYPLKSNMETGGLSRLQSAVYQCATSLSTKNRIKILTASKKRGYSGRQETQRFLQKRAKKSKRAADISATKKDGFHRPFLCAL